MSTDSIGWAAGRDFYRRAEVEAVDHEAGCSVCASGAVCADADDAYEAEARAFTHWRRFDRAGAQAEVLSQAPTE